MCTKILIFLCLTIIGNGFALEELIERKIRGDAPLEECEGKPADIALIIDSSRSIYGPDYDKGLEFLRRFINNFHIDSDNVRIAAVSFGERVITDTAFGFDKYDNKGAVLAGIKAVRFRPELGGSTNTAIAIAYARKNFFVNARPNVNAKKIAIVLTDGRSNNFIKTKAEADLLKSQMVKIIAIGVGSAILEKELHAIATSNEYVFKVSSYDALKNIIRTLGIITCKDKKETTLPPCKPEDPALLRK